MVLRYSDNYTDKMVSFNEKFINSFLLSLSNKSYIKETPIYRYVLYKYSFEKGEPANHYFGKIDNIEKDDSYSQYNEMDWFNDRHHFLTIRQINLSEYCFDQFKTAIRIIPPKSLDIIDMFSFILYRNDTKIYNEIEELFNNLSKRFQNPYEISKGRLISSGITTVPILYKDPTLNILSKSSIFNQVSAELDEFIERFSKNDYWPAAIAITKAFETTCKAILTGIGESGHEKDDIKILTKKVLNSKIIPSKIDNYYQQLTNVLSGLGIYRNSEGNAHGGPPFEDISLLKWSSREICSAIILFVEKYYDYSRISY